MNSQKTLIMIGGHARHGKDTLAKLVQDEMILAGARYQIIDSAERLRAGFRQAIKPGNYTPDEVTDIITGNRKSEPLPCLGGRSYRDWMRHTIQSTNPARFALLQYQFVASQANQVILVGVRWRHIPKLYVQAFQSRGWRVLSIWVERPWFPLVEEDIKNPQMHLSPGWFDVRVRNTDRSQTMIRQLRAQAPWVFHG